MRKVRWILRFLGICIVAFAAGIVAGFVKNGVENTAKGDSEAVTDEAVIVMEEEDTVEYYPKRLTHYLVESDEDYIILVEVFDDESKNVVDISPFSRSVLPASDIELLEEGMTFSDKDEALLMIENFTS